MQAMAMPAHGVKAKVKTPDNASKVQQTLATTTGVNTAASTVWLRLYRSGLGLAGPKALVIVAGA
jgi:hypothetical protein